MIRPSLVIGAAGNLLAVPSLMLFAVSGLSFGFWPYGSMSGNHPWMIPTTVVLLSVSLLLQSAGFYGLWKESRSRFSAICAPFGIALSLLILVVAEAICCLGRDRHFLLTSVSVFLLGVLFVLQGLAYDELRNDSRQPRISQVAAALFIVGGSFLFSLYLQVVGFVLLMIPLAMGTLIMLRRT